MKRNATVWICALLTLSPVIAWPTDNAGASGSPASATVEGQAAPRAVTFINDVYELQNMSKDLNGTYALANDINASVTSGWNKRMGFNPIGNSPGFFNGTFDGRGFKISNLYIDRPNNRSVGLFGAASKSTRFSNVSLLRVSVTGNLSVGALVGTSLGSITNCSVSGSVNGGDYSGGLAGLIGDCAISRCNSSASVRGDNATGGIAGGALNMTISNCQSQGTVNGLSAAGGLVGLCERTRVLTSQSSGTVIGDYVAAGGLVGGLVNGEMSNCSSTASVFGGMGAGGFAGTSNNGTITDCYSTGTVKGKFLTGGLAGYCFESTVSKSWSQGTVNGEYSIAGGLAGNITDSEISKCYSTAPVSCPNHTGGLVGQSASSVISDSYATGAVNGKNMTGGLAGAIGLYGIILNCYSTGAVAGISFVGGLIGATYGTTYGTPTVTNSFWDKQTSGRNTSAGGAGKTTSEMYYMSTFWGWSFSDVWGINDGNTYPFLLCFYTLPKITGNDAPSVREDSLYFSRYNVSCSDYPKAKNNARWSLNTTASRWLAVNETTGNLSGTPDNADVGVYRVNLSATDKLNYVSWRNFTVRVENVPPVFTDLPPDNITLKQDEIWTSDVNFSDEGLGNTSLGLVQAPKWLAMDSTGAMYARPGHNDMGNYPVTLFADDGWGGIINHSFQIVVVSDNTPPTISTQDVLTATQGIPYSVKYEATDIDPDDTTFLWALATNATWLAMHSATGVLSGTPGIADIGSWAVNVTVVDERGGRDSTDFVLTVLRTNAPPVLTTAAIPSATKGVPYRFSLTATDPDAGDVLVWSLNTTAGWLSIDAGTGALSGTPGESDVGSFSVNVTVKDRAGATASVTYTIRVLTVNGPPVWVSAPGNMSVTEGQRFLFTMQANDPDGDPVQYRVSSQPACGISIDLALGELSWNNPTVGEYALNVSATAGQFTIYHEFVLKVNVLITNNPPTIQAVANATATVGKAFSLKLAGSDLDSRDAANLTFRLVSGPAGMVVSAEGSVLWFPAKDDVGKRNVTVSLSDGKSSTTATFTVTVNAAAESAPSGIPTGASLAWLVLIPFICYAFRRRKRR